MAIQSGFIITKWTSLRPRKDFARGYSCCLLDEGFKISWHIDATDKLMRYYCDIVDVSYDAAANAYTFHDLLVDVVIMPDGFVKVLDVGEVPEALDKGLITIEQAKLALTRLDKLLAIVYNGDFGKLITQALPYIQEENFK